MTSVSAVSAVGTWTAYTSGNTIRDMTVYGDQFWCATNGGVVLWNIATGDYILYNTDDGLPVNDIIKVVVQNDSTVWAVSERGISRLNGGRWELDTLLPGSKVDMAAAGPDGRLYVRTYYALHVYDGMSWSQVTATPEKARDGECYDMLITESGNIYCSFWNYGVWRYSNHTWDGISTADGLPVDEGWRFAVTRDSTVWAAGNQGVITIDDSKELSFTDIGKTEHLANYNNRDITVSGDGAICLLSYFFVAKAVDGQWKNVFQSMDKHFMSIACDSKGSIYIGSSDNGNLNMGLYCIDDGKYYTIPEGPAETSVSSLAMAHDGSLWMETTGGITELYGTTWSYPSYEGEFLFGHPYPSPDGSIWVYSNTQGMFRIADNEMIRYDVDDGLPGEVNLSSLAVAPDGTVWAALYSISSIGIDGRLYHFDGAHWNVCPESDLIDHSRPTQMVVTGDGILWLNIAGTLYRYVNNEPVKADTPLQGIVKTIEADGNGNLWISGDNGVYMLRDGVWKEIASRGYSVICPGEDGSILMAVETRTEYNAFDMIVVKVDGDHQERLEVADGMTRTRILDIVTDSRGTAWVGTGNGLYRYTPDNGVFVKATDLPAMSPAITAIRPNPFNPSTVIEFTLSSPGLTEVSIYNVIGQNVRTLVSERMRAGSHSLVWNGKNDSGHDLSSGVYIAKLRSGQFSATRKMVLQR